MPVIHDLSEPELPPGSGNRDSGHSDRNSGSEVAACPAPRPWLRTVTVAPGPVARGRGPAPLTAGRPGRASLSDSVPPAAARPAAGPAARPPGPGDGITGIMTRARMTWIPGRQQSYKGDAMIGRLELQVDSVT